MITTIFRIWSKRYTPHTRFTRSEELLRYIGFAITSIGADATTSMAATFTLDSSPCANEIFTRSVSKKGHKLTDGTATECAINKINSANCCTLRNKQFITLI